MFAAYAAYTDHEIGRVIQTVEDLGKLDNTLIIRSGTNCDSREACCWCSRRCADQFNPISSYALGVTRRSDMARRMW